RYGSLSANLADELSGAELKLAEALGSGDQTRIDAAKALVEHESLLYTSDDEIEKVVRNQHARAETKVTLELAAEKARLRAQLEGGDITMEQYQAAMRAWGEKEKAKDAAVKAEAMRNMADLKEAYGQATGGAQSFDQLVLQET